MKNDLQADLTADLLTDLGRPTPLPSAPPVLPPLPELPVSPGTPAVTLRLTPMKWARPCLEGAERGTGVAMCLGPWRIEIAF